MKTHSRLLRGYNNNQFSDRSRERCNAPSALKNRKPMDLPKVFSSKRRHEEAKNKENDEQENFCGECNCSCTCNADCNGDVRKCTSRKAIEKGCTHCCECWQYPFAKNMKKNDKKEKGIWI